jgi:hypothetical protein
MKKTHYYTGDKDDYSNNYNQGYKKAVATDILLMSIKFPNDIFKYKNYDKMLYIKKGHIFKKDIIFDKYEKKTIQK